MEIEQFSQLHQSFSKVSVDISNHLNKALHKDLLANNEVRYRARMLLLLGYMFMFMLSLLALALLFAPFSNSVKAIGLGFWFFLSCAIAAVNYLLQVRGNFWVAVYLLLAAITLSTFVGIVLTGGPSISPVTELVLFFPLISFYLMGLNAGLFWSLLNILLLIACFVLDALAYSFVNIIPGQHSMIASGLIYVSGFVTLVFMVFIYEQTLTGLQSQQQKSQSQVRYLANHDQLTGIANRPHFYKVLESSMLKHKHQGHEEQLALVYMDLVGFKEVNDVHGHHTGDIVLQRIAQNLQDSIRGTDLVARHGGDEFVILLKRVKDEQALEGIADKIAEIVSQPIDVVGLELRVLPSMGISFFPQHAQDITSLERCADQAMYEAKAKKRDWKIYQGAFSAHEQCLEEGS